MPRIKKKGTSGQAKNFITRTQAVRKLQISLPDFRRLCIFKGIYPREPRNKKKASKSATASTTFYYTKDIQYLLHEPLLRKFRDHHALAKKIARHLGRGEATDAARLEKTQTPRLTLDHIIKERYPTFVDALRDLDDALSMLFLFANLPSTANITPKTVALCQRLCLEFEHYLIVSHSLRKSFLSIKGIYYQATIQGQDILWLVPYKFVQRISSDIDFRIMGTFIEFYTTLMGFVNYRLYTSMGLLYPPRFNAKSDESGGELGAYILQGRGTEESNQQRQLTNGRTDDSLQVAATARAQIVANTLNEFEQSSAADQLDSAVERSMQDEIDATSAEPSTAIDRFSTTASTDVDILPQPGPSSNEAATLFANTTFFLSRETPRQPLEFLLKAFGCKRVCWDAVLGDGAYTNDESDGSITHQVVDRPLASTTDNVPDQTGNGDETPVPAVSAHSTRYQNRVYIQPQWVWDSINSLRLLRPDLYAPGATLPPHLSPFVKVKPGQYDPTQPLEDQVISEDTMAREGDAAANEEDEINSSDVESDNVGEEEVDEEMALAGTFDALPRDETEDIATVTSRTKTATLNDNKEEDDFSGFSSDESDEETAALKREQAELLAESRGEPIAQTQPRMQKNGQPLKSALKKSNQKPTPADRVEKERQEQLERRKMMASRRNRKLYEKMDYSNKKRDEETQRLTAKRRSIEADLKTRKKART